MSLTCNVGDKDELDPAEFLALTSAVQSGALDRDDATGEEFSFGRDDGLDRLATLVGKGSKRSRRRELGKGGE
jgi:hypothetical protein